MERFYRSNTGWVGLMKLLFCRSNTIGSRLIRLVTWSDWSHVAIVDGDEVIEAIWPRVRVAKLADVIVSHTELRIEDYPTPRDGEIVAAARSQIGKRYDLLGMLGIGLHRDWQDDDAWWCSELPAWACAQAGVPFFRAEALHRVVPQHWWMLYPK